MGQETRGVEEETPKEDSHTAKMVAESPEFRSYLNPAVVHLGQEEQDFEFTQDDVFKSLGLVSESQEMIEKVVDLDDHMPEENQDELVCSSQSSTGSPNGMALLALNCDVNSFRPQWVIFEFGGIVETCFLF